MKKRIVYIFIIPLLIIIFAVYGMNRLTREKIREQSQHITIAEGRTIQTLLDVAGRHLADEGEDPLIYFLDSVFDNELIIYVGLFKQDNLIHLLARFEDYFPVMQGREDLHVIDSPIGKILNITGTFKDKDKNVYHLHIGFNYQFLSTFEHTLSRNFYVVAGMFTLIVLLITALVIYFDKKIFKKELELERETQEKDRFKELSLLTSEIAHEIKNPLNSIYLSFTALEKYLSADENAVFYRDAVKGEIQRITAIIQSYSDLSEKIKPRPQPTDLDKLAAEFQWMMKGELERRHTRLDYEINAAANPVMFDTDRDLLKQVLLNLVKNAVEAGATQVNLAFAPAKKQLDLTVTDNGRGIDDATAADIFKPYVSTKTKGMGLGLHVVKKILDALNGSIRLTSHTPGKTAFKIQIPGGLF